MICNLFKLILIPKLRRCGIKAFYYRTKHNSIIKLNKNNFFLRIIIKMLNIKPISNNSNPRYQNIYTFIFEFEDELGSAKYVDSWVNWMRQNWTLSILSSIIYIFVIFGIKLYMRTRPRFELRKPLIVWNLFLATFSLWGTLRVWPDFIYSLVNEGFIYTVCDNQCVYGRI